MAASLSNKKFKTNPKDYLQPLPSAENLKLDIQTQHLNQNLLPLPVSQNFAQKKEETFDLSKTKDLLKQSAYQVAVVKFGGNAITNEAVLDGLINDTVALIKAGIKVIVVHGGGTMVNDALKAIGKSTTKINGLRVTDAETLELAVDVFSAINKKLCNKFHEKGISALGFCSPSSIPFMTKKMVMEDSESGPVDLGWVGEITDVKSSTLERWMYNGWLPIVSPLGIDESGHFYNINADHAALALATNMQVDGLVFMTDVPGVLENFENVESCIGHVTPQTAHELIAQGKIVGGMLPKVKSCIAGVNSGINRIAILNSFEQNALLNGFVAPQSIGTLITQE